MIGRNLLLFAFTSLVCTTASLAVPLPKLESYSILGNTCNKDSVEIITFGSQLVVKPDYFEVNLEGNQIITANCNVAATFIVDPNYSYSLDKVTYYGLAEGRMSFVNFNREYYWAGARSDQRNDLYFFSRNGYRSLQESDADSNVDRYNYFQITDYVANDLGDTRGWSPCGAEKVTLRVSTFLTAGPQPYSDYGIANAGILAVTSEGPMSASFKAKPCR